MATGEFALIDRFFKQHAKDVSVVKGIGDDCALLQLPADKLLAVSMDTLVADVHFPADGNAAEIAQRALRVNLSDLAAMGAEPLWFTLGLTLPEVDEVWLQQFSQGLFAAASEYGVALVGGDTTRGPLSITVQVHGAVARGDALTRDGAQLGDAVYVTGTMGDAAAGLALLQGRAQTLEPHASQLMARYYRPTPHIRDGRLLAGIASAAIDVSDGLLADLGHICEQSSGEAAEALGAAIDAESLPLSPAMESLLDSTGEPLPRQQLWRWALTGGDDYRLCFTVPVNREFLIQEMCEFGDLEAYRIGEIQLGKEVACYHGEQLFMAGAEGYNHFDDAS